MELKHPIDLALVVSLDELFPGGWSPDGIYELLKDIVGD